jgi:lysophospholipase L1-like esterase
MRKSPHARMLLAVLISICPATLFAKDPETIPALKAEVQTAEGAKSWWIPRHEEKLAERKKMGQVDLLMIGDSITHGWENGGRKTWDKYYAKRKALNIGFSGDRTEQVLWRFANGEIDEISPKLAIVMIGTNNAGHRKDPAEQTAAGIKAIVNQLRGRLPKTKVLLLAIFPRGESKEDELRQLNKATNEIIAGLADDENVFFLDINSKFLEDGGRLPRAIMPDLLHPNAKGYEVWAEAMEPTVKRLMNE